MWPSSTPNILGYAFLKDWYFSLQVQNKIFQAAEKRWYSHADLNSPGLTVAESE